MSDEKVDSVYLVTEKSVYGFFRDHRYLSNFHEASFIDKDARIWPTSEHFYQAMKSKSEKQQEEARFLPLNEIKKWGRNVKVREDWEEVKDSIMLEALVYKFTQNEDIKLKLIDTGTMYLEETNWWRDTHWGVYCNEGKNMLGKLLMALREVLKVREGDE
jgi:ribA/ribD-fused uncharacterized protein